MANEHRPLPDGYRGGIITAITVLLGFSLLFLRFWGFEAPGQWSTADVLATLLLGISILLQFVALWRALQVGDNDEAEYRKTLRWFLSAAITLFLSIAAAALVHSGILSA